MTHINHQDWFEFMYDLYERNVQPSWREFKLLWHAASAGPFLDQRFLELVLWRLDFKAMPRTRFIDYSLALEFYHSDETTPIQIVLSGPRGPVSWSKQLPYKTLVDFVAQRNARILVSPPTVSEYVMPEHLIVRTQPNLEVFTAEKPNTDLGGTILRIADFERIDETNYLVRLERGKYEAQIRTNLTLDYRPKPAEQTLREFDVSPDRRLKSFRDSCMVNSIGVSAAVFLRRKSKCYFFAKVRSKQVAVFASMLGTVSGVVEEPKGRRIEDLVEYAKGEILRELKLETGLDYLAGQVKAVHPLVFARELSRGGKPQFFFLIEVPDMLDRQLHRLFQSAPESIEEFQDEWHEDAFRFRKIMTPEFATNLALAFHALKSMPAEA